MKSPSLVFLTKRNDFMEELIFYNITPKDLTQRHKEHKVHRGRCGMDFPRISNSSFFISVLCVLRASVRDFFFWLVSEVRGKNIFFIFFAPSTFGSKRRLYLRFYGVMNFVNQA